MELSEAAVLQVCREEKDQGLLKYDVSLVQ